MGLISYALVLGRVWMAWTTSTYRPRIKTLPGGCGSACRGVGELDLQTDLQVPIRTNPVTTRIRPQITRTC